MANTVKARIQLKYDTEENWSKAIRFCPLKGEVIIYAIDDTHPFPRLKVGDGVTPVVDLPFLSDANENKNIQYHTAEYWNSQLNYIPAQGQIIVYSDNNLIKKRIEKTKVNGYINPKDKNINKNKKIVKQYFQIKKLEQ